MLPFLKVNLCSPLFWFKSEDLSIFKVFNLLYFPSFRNELGKLKGE